MSLSDWAKKGKLPPEGLSTLARAASERALKYDTIRDHEKAAQAHARAAEAQTDREKQNEHRGKSADHTARAQQLRDAHGRFTK